MGRNTIAPIPFILLNVRAHELAVVCVVVLATRLYLISTIGVPWVAPDAEQAMPSNPCLRAMRHEGAGMSPMKSTPGENGCARVIANRLHLPGMRSRTGTVLAG